MDNNNFSKNKRKRKSHYSRGAYIGFVITAIVIIAVIIFAVISLRGCGKEKTPPRPTVEIGGQNVEINEDIPQSELEVDDFTVEDDGKVSYEGGGESYGIDVSSHQGNIDWQAVKSDGFEFAIIRLGFRGMTEGLMYPDETYKQNLEGAAEAGIKTGVYFFSQAISEEEAIEEAEYVLELLEGYDLQLPVFFDWEPGLDPEYRSYDVPFRDIGHFADVFCETVENAGFETGIYFNSLQGYLHYDLAEFEDSCLWLAEYDTKPDFKYSFHIWQYSNTGTVAGIDGDVDLNICFDQSVLQ